MLRWTAPYCTALFCSVGQSIATTGSSIDIESQSDEEEKEVAVEKVVVKEVEEAVSTREGLRQAARDDIRIDSNSDETQKESEIEKEKEKKRDGDEGMEQKEGKEGEIEGEKQENEEQALQSLGRYADRAVSTFFTCTSYPTLPYPTLPYPTMDSTATRLHPYFTSNILPFRSLSLYCTVMYCTVLHCYFVSAAPPWVPCGLCGLDCTWVYIMHSDAHRALVTHRCK
jgi:hypothetical protein